MSSGTILAIAIPLLVVLAAVAVLSTASRYDRSAATGTLSPRGARRGRSQIPVDESAEAQVVAGTEAPRPTGREIERAAVLERTGRAVVVSPPAPPPAPVAPLDPVALGVTRRKFLNRGIVNLFGIGLGGFGLACLAFLYPKAGRGFGAKFTLPESIDDIIAQNEQEREPYYYAPARTYVVPYPKAALSKGKAIYPDSVIEGMDAGVVALYQKCPHLGCRVPWCATSQWFECPCHGSQYNRVGEKKGGPAPRGMDRFPVKVQGNRITVDTGLVIQGPPIGTNTTGQETEGPHCVGGGE